MAHDIKISYEPSINSKAMAISLVVYFSWLRSKNKEVVRKYMYIQ